MFATVVVLMIVSALVAAGGVSWRRRRRALLTAAVQTPVNTEQGPRSLTDAFEALGGTSFALEVLAQRRLLPADPKEAETLPLRLHEEFRQHGGYGAWLADMEEAQREVGLHPERAVIPWLTGQGLRQLPGPSLAGGWEALSRDFAGLEAMGTLVRDVFTGDPFQAFERFFASQRVENSRRELETGLRQLGLIALRPDISGEILGRIDRLTTAWDAERARLGALRALARQHRLSSPGSLDVLVESAEQRATAAGTNVRMYAWQLQALLRDAPSMGRELELGWVLYQNRTLLLEPPPPNLASLLSSIDRAWVRSGAPGGPR